MGTRQQIQSGQTALGIELGTTRIKSVLTDPDGAVLAVGVYDWENAFENGVWTYRLEDVEAGMQECYAELKQEVYRRYGVRLTRIGAIGISAMMHGYLALDAQDRQLAPFQTWRNTNTERATDTLTDLFDFNIPHRWSVAHLYQRILDGEAHVRKIAFLTTLAGWVHWRLTGEKVLGVGDASGMFPIDGRAADYDAEKLELFDRLVEPCGFSWTLRGLLPRVLTAGQEAGRLTEEGSLLLDPGGDLLPGIPFCPPEGDAGTGMVATNSVAPHTGNLSAGTSIFAMIVLDRPLSRLHREIDLVMTPTGRPVAMSHASNGTTELNAWVNVFGEFAELMGLPADPDSLYTALCAHSLTGTPDCGGLLPYGYYSGEGIIRLNEGRPILIRTPESRFTLANLVRAQLYSSLGAVRLGLDILQKKEHVRVDRLLGHGGLFKTRGVMQRYLAAAAGTAVSVTDTASEGGAWGAALLAAYLLNGRDFGSLEAYLERRVFSTRKFSTVRPDPFEAEGFERFMERYRAALPVERAATQYVSW